MTTQSIHGEASTFATLMVWDEAQFAYQRIIDCARHRDARAEYFALHAPPLVIVETVRIDGKVFRP